MDNDTELIELLDRPVKLRKLVEKLFFELDDLEYAALHQPKLYLETGRFRAQQALLLNARKRKLTQVIGTKSLRIRRKHQGEKYTEGAIKNELSQNTKLRKLQRMVDNSEVYLEFASQLSEAYKERMMILNILGKIRASEISSELRSAAGEEVVERMRKKANKVRDRFSELGDSDD